MNGRYYDNEDTSGKGVCRWGLDCDKNLVKTRDAFVHFQWIEKEEESR